MSKGKGKKQFQGAGRRFRADIWMDEKVSARTMYALQERGVKFPPGTNVRGRSRRQKRKPSAQHGKPNGRNRLRRKAHNNLFAQSELGTDLHIDLISSP